ncbi:MAG TPA: ROK family protein [Terracidiphilus sp.]|nr:ROK family protein [Terracidiphilus sp.]
MNGKLGRTVIVYDVGGSHISAAVCREPDYELGTIRRAQLPVEETVKAFVGVLQSLAGQVAADTNSMAGASLAMPGPFDYARGISFMQHKLPYLFGRDLRQAFADSLEWVPDQIKFLNDAAAYMLGEIGAGAAKDFSRVVVLTLGTGVGSGFAIDGTVQTEGEGVPPGGEIWNVPYEGGIVEDQISTRALQKSYRDRTGNRAEVAAIAAAATTEKAAAEVFAEFGHTLGKAIKALLTDFAPDVVVLGGGIARSAKLFLPEAQSELAGLGMDLRVAKLDESAPLVGAGVHWLRG